MDGGDHILDYPMVNKIEVAVGKVKKNQAP